MTRRELIALLGSTAVSWPLGARAQQPERIRRIGVLSTVAADDPEVQARMAAFHQGLQETGWVIGRNLRIEYRWSGMGDPGQVRKYAAAIDGLAPVILAVAASAVGPLQEGAPQYADRIRAGQRSSRGWLCREHGSPGRQRDPDLPPPNSV